MGQNGNTYEWMEDAAGNDNYQADLDRVIRGGMWLDPEFRLRSSDRYDNKAPTLSSQEIGFRVASKVPLGPEFQSDPAPNTPLAFGSQLINTEGAAQQVKVDNLGDQDLTLNCTLSGESSHFVINACVSPVSPAAFTNIEVACKPTSIGAKNASLDLTSNDADEPAASYPLTCTGTNEPPLELILEDGFESP